MILVTHLWSQFTSCPHVTSSTWEQSGFWGRFLIASLQRVFAEMKCSCMQVTSPCITVLGSIAFQPIRYNGTCIHADTRRLFNWQRDYEIYSFAAQRINYASWTPAAPAPFASCTGWAPILVKTWRGHVCAFLNTQNSIKDRKYNYGC